MPTLERVELLDMLARCYRAVAGGPDFDAGHRGDAERMAGGPDSDPGHRGDAERTARAALRELRRCVLLADDVATGLAMSARAIDIVARTVSWNLADGRVGPAVETVEVGRSLVLASVGLAGRVEDELRATGQATTADAWRRGDERGRIAGLDAISSTIEGQALLATPNTDQIGAAAVGTTVDAVVYLVPPPPPDETDLPAQLGHLPARSLTHPTTWASFVHHGT